MALRQTKEKIVLVSNFTSTLDVLQVLLGSKGMTWCRLDGNTDTNKRQQIVDQFNIADADTCCTPPP
jgi:DNA repair and recombination protein RAD54B